MQMRILSGFYTKRIKARIDASCSQLFLIFHSLFLPFGFPVRRKTAPRISNIQSSLPACYGTGRQTHTAPVHTKTADLQSGRIASGKDLQNRQNEALRRRFSKKGPAAFSGSRLAFPHSSLFSLPAFALPVFPSIFSIPDLEAM